MQTSPYVANTATFSFIHVAPVGLTRGPGADCPRLTVAARGLRWRTTLTGVGSCARTVCHTRQLEWER